ncbi:hypothetical protein CAOG_08185 [Capsaspora owczarzaki ATCC 30864]|uniref:DH domain-containing protein n=1 Tax=Capsaspora owczarzaki (strain ATCC 30864) TaxID=595528 RepID=A0A0D2UT87_CAPO3|nr:hypothetical protein CAOG_08185 [Capsaspora owczarzaki ATCC 30864]KJE98181.1 hypothetical protein CAOG_008185 [Capsaspora owczarzaki ATCC 30864]|eukprot:XP_004342786.1 hypothetical protein CAOG_08185 [Capsaspora owczarzaki ATCC 30864]
MDKLALVIKELLLTERGYVDDLALVITGYMRPLQLAAGCSLASDNSSDSTDSPSGASHRKEADVNHVKEEQGGRAKSTSPPSQFATPASAFPGAPSQSQIRAIFCNIEDIHAAHCALLARLEAAQGQQHSHQPASPPPHLWLTPATPTATEASATAPPALQVRIPQSSVSLQDPEARGRVVAALCNALADSVQVLQPLYIKYFENYPSAEAMLGDLLKNPASLTAALVRQCQSDLRQTLGLAAFLIKPVQRLLKYPLLLRELEKEATTALGEFLPPDSVNSDADEGAGKTGSDSGKVNAEPSEPCWLRAIQQAQAAVGGLAEHLNQVRRELDTFDIVRAGTENWPDKDLTQSACGRLLAEAPVIFKRSAITRTGGAGHDGSSLGTNPIESITFLPSLFANITKRHRHVLLFEHMLVLLTAPSVALVPGGSGTKATSSGTHQRFKLSMPVNQIQVRQNDVSTSKSPGLSPQPRMGRRGSWTESFAPPPVMSFSPVLHIYNMATRDIIELQFLSTEAKEAFCEALQVQQFRAAFNRKLVVSTGSMVESPAARRVSVIPEESAGPEQSARASDNAPGVHEQAASAGEEEEDAFDADSPLSELVLPLRSTQRRQTPRRAMSIESYDDDVNDQDNAEQEDEDLPANRDSASSMYGLMLQTRMCTKWDLQQALAEQRRMFTMRIVAEQQQRWLQASAAPHADLQEQTSKLVAMAEQYRRRTPPLVPKRAAPPPPAPARPNSMHEALKDGKHLGGESDTSSTPLKVVPGEYHLQRNSPSPVARTAQQQQHPTSLSALLRSKQQ